MKNKSSKLSIVITLFLTVLIIGIGYKALAYAGASFLDNENGIERLPTGNSASYVFYSQSEDDITLFPWTYYNDAVSSQAYDINNYVIDIVSDNLYGNFIYYFYRMISKDLYYFLHNDKDNMYISLAERIKYEEITKDLKIVTLPNNDLVYYYSKDFLITDQTYNLNISFKINFDYSEQEFYVQVLSFQTKHITNTTPSKEYINASKEYLSNYINSNSDSIDNMCYDFINKRNAYDFYSLLDNESYGSTEDTLNIKESTDITDAERNALNEKYKNSTNYDDYNYGSEEKILQGNTSYQLVYTNNEFLIICLENNIVLHYDPTIYTITGFNLLETYLSPFKY